MGKPPQESQFNYRSAMKFIVLMGMVSLFADMTYEGARSISGPYLALLGASGAVVGFVSGFGELIGYALRALSGYITDRTRSYWSMAILGYSINLFAVPLLAITQHWQTAAILLIVERLGKAMRVPARDAMLSYATQATGRGWGFGIHEALDKIGGLLGPILISAILFYRHSYTLGFACLLFPALCAIAILFLSRRLYPHPENLEIPHTSITPKGLKGTYWLYIAASCFIAAGFIDYPLIAYHFELNQIASPAWIPLLYSIAMGVEGLSSLALGKWFDRKGIFPLIISTALSACVAPFVFLGSIEWAIAGIVLWGIGMGGQQSIMRAVIAHLVDSQQRATGYGIFNLWFGIFWFVGSFLMGYLYDVSLIALMIFSVGIQFISLPLLWKVNRGAKTLPP